MPRKFHRQAEPRFDNRKLKASKRFDYYEGVLIGHAVDAPDQFGGYNNLTPKEKIKEWREYSCRLIMIAGDMNNQFRALNK